MIISILMDLDDARFEKLLDFGGDFRIFEMAERVERNNMVSRDAAQDKMERKI